MMLNIKDKIIEARLYSPHKCEFICEREDGTHYVYRRLDDEEYYELQPNLTGETKWIWGQKIEQK
jgi:hypothetical protein